MQIRSNALEADVVVVGLPDNVLAGYKTAAARQNFVGNLTAVVGDLRDAGFERLHYLSVPSSVMTVRATEVVMSIISFRVLHFRG